MSTNIETGEITVNSTWKDGHESARAEAQLVPGIRRVTLTYQGTWAYLKAEMLNKMRMGCTWDVQNTGMEDQLISSARLTRGDGDVCTMTVTLLEDAPTEFWSVEYATLTKDIRTWKADTENADDKPDLSKIRSWEALKRSGDLESYNAFLPAVGEEPMEGNTRKLAEKIAAGITCYTMHTPVVTRTVTTTEPASYLAEAKYLDKKYTPCTLKLEGNEEVKVAGRVTAESFAGLKTDWVFTNLRVTANSDGTFTCVAQWTGADAVDKDLYDEVEKEDGGSDSGGSDSGGSDSGGSDSGGSDSSSSSSSSES